jgi:hypothetical protein
VRVLRLLGVVCAIPVVIAFLSDRHARLAAAGQDAITNADVIRMVAAKLGDAVITQAIEVAKERRFDLRPSALIELKKAGVSDAIILVMQNATRAQSAPAPSPSAGTVDVIRVSSVDRFIFVSVMLHSSGLEEVPLGDPAAAEIRLRDARSFPLAAVVLPNQPSPAGFTSTAIRFSTRAGSKARLSRTMMYMDKGDTISDVPKSWEPLFQGTRFMADAVRLELLFDAPGIRATDVEFVRVLGVAPAKVDPARVVPYDIPGIKPAPEPATSSVAEVLRVTRTTGSSIYALIALNDPAEEYLLDSQSATIRFRNHDGEVPASAYLFFGPPRPPTIKSNIQKWYIPQGSALRVRKTMMTVEGVSAGVGPLDLDTAAALQDFRSGFRDGKLYLGIVVEPPAGSGLNDVASIRAFNSSPAPVRAATVAFVLPPNTITFQNGSGEHVLVRLIGPTSNEFLVGSGESVVSEGPDGKKTWPTSASETVHVSAGTYEIRLRYGNRPDQYTYFRGDPVHVTQDAATFSRITITLHKMPGGKYRTNAITAAEFEKK